MTTRASKFARVRRALVGAAVVAAALETAWAGAFAPEAAARAANPEAGATAVGASTLRNALRQHPLATLDGKAVSWEALRGEVVVVSFWATWCKPCRKELPKLDRLNAELAKTGGRVLAVSIDLDQENVRRFAVANKLELPICHDGPDGLAKQLALEQVPYTVVLDRSGTVAYASAGADAARLDALVAKARSLANAPRTAAVSDEVTP
jgi:thiol-disulfide isomerase/thioredoxin